MLHWATTAAAADAIYRNSAAWPSVGPEVMTVSITVQLMALDAGIAMTTTQRPAISAFVPEHVQRHVVRPHLRVPLAFAETWQNAAQGFGRCSAAPGGGGPLRW